MSDLERADGLIKASKAEQRRSRRLRPRAKEQRIVDPATHPRRYVSLVVAAEYLEVDRKTLGAWLLNGEIPYSVFGRRRKIEVAELVAFEQRKRVQPQAS